MTVYYVDTAAGSDGNAGTSPGASAWATLNKALTTMASGDTVYLAGGQTHRALQKPTITPTAETKVIGDTYGFNTNKAGEVIVTAYTTNDKTAPASTAPTLDLNGKNFFTFQNITFVGANRSAATCVGTSTGNPHDIKFVSCAFLSPYGTTIGSYLMGWTFAADAQANLTIQRCFFGPSYGGHMQFSVTLSSSADYDLNNLVENNEFLSSLNIQPVKFISTGSGNFRPAGGSVRYNTFVGCFGAVFATNASTGLSANKPLYFYNNLILSNNATQPITGQVFEDGNIMGGTAQSLATFISGGSISKGDGSYATLMHMGQDSVFNGANPVKRFVVPYSNSPALAFAPFSDITGSVGASASDDGGINTAWTNPSNALSYKEPAGEAYATATNVLATVGTSNYLQIRNPAGATNLGFTIPSDATILGVRVDVNRKASATASISWNSVKLVKGGSQVGTDQASSAQPNNNTWGSTDGTNYFGNSSSLWGTTLAPSDVNASNFGVDLQVKNTAGTNQTASIDWVLMTIYYVRGWTNMPVDITGERRPSGSSSTSVAAGAYEYHNTAVLDTSTYDTTDTDTASYRIDGPGYHDLYVPIASTTTQITVKARYNSGYGASGNKPAFKVLENGEVGVAGQTVTATTSALNAWETKTITISPTAAGVLTIRFISDDSSGSGSAWCDTWRVNS